MSSLMICPDCGTDIPSDAPAGVCPKCLLQAALTDPFEANAPTMNTDVLTSAGAPTLSPLQRDSDVTAILPERGTDVKLFGEYELLEEVARGGMGVVYKARQIRLNRTVALKRILAGQFAGRADIRRFQAEAEAAAQLDHPGIVPIFEVGECDGHHYFSMGFISGESLASRLLNGPLPPQEAAALLRATAEAIQYAHDHGVIHRDLKPANILLDTDGQPRMTDFGLAKQAKQDSGLTATGQVLGTPSYMPPEQASGRGHDVQKVSDVYSLGAVLYSAITGRPPFQSDNQFETLTQVLKQEPVAPRQLNPAVPQDLETICLKSLQKDKRKRYQSAAEFAAELQRFLDGRPIVARPIGRMSRFARWCRRNPAIAFPSGLAAASLIAGLTIAVCFAVETRGQRDLAIDEKQRAAIAAREAGNARDDANRKLWSSYVAQARAVRWSRRLGQRFSGLDSLRKASVLLPSLKLDESVAADRRLQLRDEAVACLSLPDMRVAWEKSITDPWSRFTAFNSGFDQYAQGDKVGNVRVCRTANDRELFRLPKQKGSVIGIEYDSSGEWLAVKHRFRGPNKRLENVVHVWDLKKRRIVASPSISHSGFAFCFHPDGGTFAVGNQMGRVKFHDLKTGRIVRSIDAAFHPVQVRFSADGNSLAVCTEAGRVLALDLVQTGESPPARAAGRIDFADGAADIAWHPSERILAVASKNGSINVWDLRQRRKLINTLKGHEDPVVGVCFHPSGDLLASQAWDGSTRLWSVATGHELLRADGQCVRFSPDGRRLHFLRGRFGFGYWEVGGGQEYRSFISPHQGGNIRSTAVGANGELLIEAHSTGVHIRRLPDGRTLGFLPLGKTSSVLFGPNNDAFYTSGDVGVFRWPVKASASGQVLEFGPPVRLAGSGRRMSLSADGRKLAVDVGYRNALLVDVQNPADKVVFGDHERLEYIAVSPDGRWVATGTWQGYGIKIWDAQTRKLLKTLIPKAYTARPMFSPDGKWLVTTTGQDYQFWKSGSWERKHRILRDGGSNVPGVIAFSKTGLMVVASSRKNVQLIDPDSGNLITRLQPSEVSNVGELCLSPSGRRLVVIRGKLEFWDLRLIRRQLSTMHLDWNDHTSPAPPRNASPKTPTRIKVDLGGLKIPATSRR